MDIPTLDSLSLSGKRVLVRADLNVSLENGRVTDASRVEACAATIREIVDRGGIPVVMSHLGRPEGKRQPSLSLKPVVDTLSDAVDGREVVFVEDCIGDAAEGAVEALSSGQVALLENLRFHTGEEENDPDFSKTLARLGDVYVNDAFSAAHRRHASIVGVPRQLPAAAGRLMERELESLERWLAEPQLPYLAILGGAKVKTKLSVAHTLLQKGADVVLGGTMATTALLARGTEIGRSACDRDQVEVAERLMAIAGDGQKELVLPTDAVVAPSEDAADDARGVAVDEVPSDAMILDLGSRTVEDIVDRVRSARTVVWNGPLGAAEHDGFAEATLRVAGAIADMTGDEKLTSVVGGGDTVAVLQRAGLLDRFTYASMAGGAFLAWLEGKALPGMKALRKVCGR